MWTAPLNNHHTQRSPIYEAELRMDWSSGKYTLLVWSDLFQHISIDLD